MTSTSKPLVALALLLALAIGCKDKPSSASDAGSDTVASNADAGADSGPTIIYKEGPEPTDDTVLAKAGDVEVTWADYQHAVRLGQLFAPTGRDGDPEKMSAIRLAAPHSHITMTRALLSRAIVMKELEKRGVVVTEEEARNYLEKDSHLQKWAEHLDDPARLEAELDKIGVKPADLMRLAREQVGQERLQQVLVEKIDEEQVWKAYQYERNRVQIVAAASSNVPSGEELDDYVSANPAKIEAYYKENQRRYTYPKRARAMVLVAPPDAGDAIASKLSAAAEALGKPGADPEKIAEKHGLTARPEQLFTATEDEGLYGVSVGQTGTTVGSPRGSYAWKKTADVPPQVRDLSFGLKREIAATILRGSTVTETAKANIEKARKAFEELDVTFGEVDRAALEPTLEELRAVGLEAKLTPPFPRTENGFVPGFGIYEELAAAAFDVSKKAPFPKEPILSREKVFTFRLVDREKPTREAFEKEKEVFTQTFRMKARQGIVDGVVRSYLDKNSPRFQLDPIKVVYGELQKE